MGAIIAANIAESTSTHRELWIDAQPNGVAPGAHAPATTMLIPTAGMEDGGPQPVERYDNGPQPVERYDDGRGRWKAEGTP